MAMANVLTKKLGLLVPTDDWNKCEIIARFLQSVDWATWGTGATYRIHPPEPPPFTVYFFHRKFVQFKATCTDILNKGDVPLDHVAPEFRHHERSFMNELIIKDMERIPETHIEDFVRYYDSQKRIDYTIRKFAYVIAPE